MEKKATTKRILLLIIIFILVWFLLVCRFETEIEELDKVNNVSQNEVGMEVDVKTETEAVTESKIIMVRGQNEIITSDYLQDLNVEGPLLI